MRRTWGSGASGYVTCRLRRSSHCKIRPAATDDHSCPCATHGRTRRDADHRGAAHGGSGRERGASYRTGGARKYGRCEHKKPERSVDPDGSIALGPTTSIAAVSSIKAIPTILYIVCRTTGMRFAAVARVTEDRWIRNRASVGLGNGISLLETSQRRCQTNFSTVSLL